MGDDSPLVEHGYHEASGNTNMRLDAEEIGHVEDQLAMSAERVFEQADAFHRRSI